MQSERHANSLPARAIRDMTLLLALSLDCRLFIQRSLMGSMDMTMCVVVLLCFVYALTW
jgi:hypothetical protein